MLARIFLVALLLVFLPIPVLASVPAVNDVDNVLSEAEFTELNDAIKAFNDSHTAYFAVLIKDDLKDSDPDALTDKYYSENLEAEHPDTFFILLYREDGVLCSLNSVHGELNMYLTQEQFDAINQAGEDAYVVDGEKPAASYCLAIIDALSETIKDSEFVVNNSAEAANAFAKKNRVFDDAGLLSPDVINKINEIASLQAEKYDIDVGVYTFTDLAGDRNVRTHADRFILKNDFGIGEEKNAILYYIYMNGTDREVGISTSGTGIDYLTDRRIDEILDESIGFLKERDFDQAGVLFINKTDDFLAAGIPEGFFRESEETLDAVDVTIGGLFGLIVAFFTRRYTKKYYSGKKASDPYDIMKNFQGSYVVNNRQIVQTSVRYEKIASDSNKSTTHRTGGHTFGGSSRKF